MVLIIVIVVAIAGVALKTPAMAADDTDQNGEGTLCVGVDVGHCIEVYVTETELDLGNVNPLEPREGEDSFQVWVKCNCEWWKKITWTGFTGVVGDDAEGSTISESRMRVYLKTGPPKPIWTEIFNGWTETNLSVREDWHKEHFSCRFVPMWCNEAGKYTGSITVMVGEH